MAVCGVKPPSAEHRRRPTRASQGLVWQTHACLCVHSLVSDAADWWVFTARNHKHLQPKLLCYQLLFTEEYKLQSYTVIFVLQYRKLYNKVYLCMYVFNYIMGNWYKWMKMNITMREKNRLDFLCTKYLSCNFA